jgi:hypothetical protein
MAMENSTRKNHPKTQAPNTGAWGTLREIMMVRGQR